MAKPDDINNPVVTVSANTNTNIEALINSYHYKWSGQSISYSFPGWSASGSAWYATGSNYDGSNNNANEWDSWSALTSGQRVAAQKAFAAWESLISAKLVEVTETSSQVGDLRVAFSAAVGDNTGNSAWGYGNYPWPYYPSAGDIWIEPAYRDGTFHADGAENYDYMALLHEIGHALGLKHPFEGSVTLPSSLDDRHYTLMSYTDYSPQTSGSGRYWAQTPMVLDIDAIQSLYGVNQNTATGNDRYAFTPNALKVMSIWDASGVDTIDGGVFNSSVTIDLRGGHYSSLGMTENIGIATRAIIENAIGGSGNDFLTGNNADNQLTGGLGNDTLDGGDGRDSSVYPGNRIDYTITQLSTTEFAITNKATGERDQLKSIETAVFADASITLDSSAAINDDYSADIKTTGSLVSGATANGNIETGGDHDWFAITLTKGATYTISLQGSASNKGTLTDPLLALRNAGGSLLQSNDNANGSSNSELRYQADSSGTYYLDASAVSTIATGTYSIGLTQSDDYPANTGTGGQLSAGGFINGTVNTAGDSDWLGIQLVAGSSYIFNLQGVTGKGGSLADPMLILRDASGKQLASNDNDGSSADSHLEYVPNHSGSYYLDASSARNGSTGSYALSASIRLIADVPSNAGSTELLKVGSSLAGILDNVSDIDWFVLDLDAGSKYRFEMRGNDSNGGSLPNPKLALRNVQGVILATDDDSGTGTDSLLEFTVSQNGRYYLDASASGDAANHIGSYTVAARQLSYQESHDSVYRFARTTDGKYLYTASSDEKSYITANFPAFRFEGSVFYAEKNATAGYLPVYRYANTLDGGYFYTTSEAEKASIAQSYPHLRAEGISFYIPRNDPNAHAVYRLANTDTGGYLFTASAEERSYALNLGHWRDEGTAFMAFTSAQTETPATSPAQAIPADQSMPTTDPEWLPTSLFDNGDLFGGH